MRRRSFLVHLGGSLAATPLLFTLTGCASDEERAPSRPGGGGGGTGENEPTGFVVRNSDSSHPHEFTMRCADEGASEMNYVATGSGHTHDVLLTEQDLIDVFEGRAVTKQTNDTHPHTWLIEMPPAGCTALPDTDPGGGDPPPDDGGW